MTRGELEMKLLHAELAEKLWTLPLISNEEAPLALGLSQSTWQMMKLEGTCPPCVMIGRRVFYRPDDLRAWVRDLQAKKNPATEDGVSEEEPTVKLSAFLPRAEPAAPSASSSH